MSPVSDRLIAFEDCLTHFTSNAPAHDLKHEQAISGLKWTIILNQPIVNIAYIYVTPYVTIGAWTKNIKDRLPFSEPMAGLASYISHASGNTNSVVLTTINRDRTKCKQYQWTTTTSKGSSLSVKSLWSVCIILSLYAVCISCTRSLVHSRCMFCLCKPYYLYLCLLRW